MTTEEQFPATTVHVHVHDHDHDHEQEQEQEHEHVHGGAVALLLPGFGGSANQPMLVRLAARLTALGVRCHRVAPPKGRPAPDLASEVAWLAGKVKETGATILIGRSFGGRVCARYAAAHGARCVVLLGFPVRPPKRPRPLDEAALLALECPTLIVQGSKDELGPLRVLRPLCAKNPRLTLHVLDGAGHSFGKHERSALEFTSEWIGRAELGRG